MKFGRVFLPGDAEMMVENARLAEEYGFDMYGVGDSQALSRELYVSLGAVARETDRIEFGPMVTNPVTRHPVVTASAACTLNEASGGRAVVGVASGDSAVYTIGERPARLAEMESAMATIRSLCRGESVEYGGKRVELAWLDDATDAAGVPIAMAAEGPKTLRLAGRVADRVVVGLGICEGIVEGVVETVHEGARAAGRDPDDVEVWFLVSANVADDRETAIEEVETSIAGTAHHSLQFSMDEKYVPDEYRDRLETLVEEYDSGKHGQTDQPANRELVERLDLVDYLVDRYAVAGTPEDCIERLRTLEAVGLADGVILGGHKGWEARITERFGEEVIHHI